MKLLFCPRCHDVLKLQSQNRACLCGASGGRYLDDDLHAEVWGEALPIGFLNDSFIEAVRRQRARDQKPQPLMDDVQAARWGESFYAFVIPATSDRVRVTPRPDPDA